MVILRSYGQVDLQNMPKTNLNMLIESPNVTSFFMALIMFDLPATSLEIFAVEMFLTLPFRIGYSHM